MSFSAKAAARERTDPTYHVQPASARARKLAGPVQLMDVKAGEDVVYLSPAARALSSAQAATIDLFPPRQITGPGWDLTA